MLLYRAQFYFVACILGAAVIVGVSGCDADKSGPESLCPFTQSATGLYCHYRDPFTKTDECNTYPGSGWDEAAIAAHCEEALPSADPGEVNDVPCDPIPAVGSCTFDPETDMEYYTWFYEYEVSSFKMGCEDMGGGTFCYNVEEEEEVETTSELLPEAVEACKSNDMVTVTPDEISDEQRADMRENGGYIFFEPSNPVSPAVGISLYPGGRIDTRSFAPAAQMLAKAGYYVALFPMPNYMALGDAIYRADEVIADHPEITNWLLTGHSMGGTGAGQNLYDKLEAGEADPLIGLVIMGSYLDEDHSLNGADVPVMMMFGTEERIANADKSKYDDAKAWLPADTIHFSIEGGFHFGFCFSENPRDDEIPLITQPEQHAIYVPRIIEFIQDIM